VLKAALTHGDIVTAIGKLHEDTIEGMTALVGPPSVTPSNAKLSPGSPGADPPPSSNPQHQHPHPRYLPLLCDVRLPASVAAVFHATLERWGCYDIVANCSGYGVIGACEDQDDADIRGQLETNFFGTLNIIQASLPYFRVRGSSKGDGEDDDESIADESMDASGDEALVDGDMGEDGSSSRRESHSEASQGRRKLRAGRYLIFSSTSGALGVPGLGPYCATKYAVEGLIESLLYEVDPFGIRATLVEPGHVRRDDSLEVPASPKTSTPVRRSPSAWPRNAATPSSALPTFGHFFIKPASPPYAGLHAPAAHARRVVQWLGDHQPTSAVKAAELVWQLGHCRFPPLRLLLGSYAVESVRDRLRTIIEEMEDWKFLNFGSQSGTKEGMKSPDEGEDDDDKAEGDIAMDHDREEAEEGGPTEDSDEDGPDDMEMADVEADADVKFEDEDAT
jgi:hypothetical protein